MIPVMIIPTYNRADLLARLIASIDYPIENLVIIDNSPNHKQRDAIDDALFLKGHAWRGYVESVHRIEHPNAGVGGSWNEGIKLFPADWWLLVNDDIQFAPSVVEHAGDLQKMHDFAAIQDLGCAYGNHGASFWAVTQLGIETVGLFDENLFPAYLEDCDWARRADLLGVKRGNCPDINSVHGDNKLTGSCTINSDLTVQANNVRTHGGNFSYYRAKWGGNNGQEVFKTPFNDPHCPLWAWTFLPENRKRQKW